VTPDVDFSERLQELSSKSSTLIDLWVVWL